MTRETQGVPAFHALPEEVTLYATSHEPRIAERLRRLFRKEHLAVSEPYPGVLSVPCSVNRLAQLSPALCKVFRPTELELIPCRLASAEARPSVAEFMQTQSLGQLIAWADGLWLDRLLTSKRLVTYFQPIVRCSQPKQVFAYECLLRGKENDGRLVLPGRLLSAARATGTLHVLDQAARLMAIESASRYQLRTCIFINFNPRFIEEPSRDMKSTLEAALASGIPPERFIFEVVESDQIVDFDRLVRVLDYCRDAGCRVALDDLGAGYSSLSLMSLVKPDFVKLDMELIRGVHKDMYKSRVASKLLELARELDVAAVVEGVQSIGEWKWAIQHGAEYSQGFLFARPAAVPPVPRTPSAASAGSGRDLGQQPDERQIQTPMSTPMDVA